MSVEDCQAAVRESLRQFYDSSTGAAIESVLRAAGAKRVKTSIRELQQAADDFRTAAGLTKAADTTRWLRANRISLDQLQHYLTIELVRRKLGCRLEGCAPWMRAGERPHPQHPRLRRDIRVDAYLSDAGERLVSITDVLLNGRDAARQLCLPQELWHVARCCDGKSDPEEIARRVRSHFGVRVGLDDVRATIEALDDHDLLDTDRSRARREEQRARLDHEPVRTTAADLLPENPADLRAALDACLGSSLGPRADSGRLCTEELPPLKGAVSPHACLDVSGPCAAHVYAALAASRLPDVVVVVGYNHVYSDGTIEVLLKDTVSPLGRLTIAREYGEAVIAHAGGALSQRGLALYDEHSIDMQIPWLQYVSQQRRTELLYLPIILSNVPKRIDAQLALSFRHKIKRVVRAVREAARRLDRQVCIIASGDFSHAGPFYGGQPVTDERTAELMAFDRRAIQLILDGRSDEFYRLTVGTTYCCPGPVYFLLEAIECRDARLLQHYTTWDVGLRGANINSFAALVFR